MHSASSFVTLTYNDEHVPRSLDYRDFQLFMKRLRKASGPGVRFFACGEYGELNDRAHWHALIFGRTFEKSSKVGEDLYRSAELERLWPKGHSSFGAVTMQSAGYVAAYSQKKVTGPLAARHYERLDLDTGELWWLTPEFGRMSLGGRNAAGGIGYPWFNRYWRDVYVARDKVVVQGKELPAPRYYDRLLADVDCNLASDKEYERYVSSQEFVDDCTPERLRAQEVVLMAKLKFNSKRKL